MNVERTAHSQSAENKGCHLSPTLVHAVVHLPGVSQTCGSNELIQVASSKPWGGLNAGVWEDARHAYLHEVLIRRVGCSAALAVVYADVMQRLLATGALDFAVRIDCSDYGALPKSEVGLT